MGALSDMVRQGKALYIGISNYGTEDTKKAIKILKDNGTPLLIHQPCYNMFNRWVENEGLLDVLEENGVGSICFSPLAQGLLTDRYLHGIPKDSRAARNVFLKENSITEEVLFKVENLNEIARERGQSLAQMSLSWVLRKDRVTSVLIGASRVEQIEDNIRMLDHMDFTDRELERIEEILK